MSAQLPNFIHYFIYSASGSCGESCKNNNCYLGQLLSSFSSAQFITLYQLIQLITLSSFSSAQLSPNLHNTWVVLFHKIMSPKFISCIMMLHVPSFHLVLHHDFSCFDITPSIATFGFTPFTFSKNLILQLSVLRFIMIPCNNQPVSIY